MLFAIASKRGPKVEAVKRVVPRIAGSLAIPPSSAKYLLREVETGIDMPRSLDELLTGAYRRVEVLRGQLQLEKVTADFLIGMEGGFHPIRHDGQDTIYLQSWAYVSNGKEGYFGSSGNVAVPERIAHEVMRRRRELGEVIDEAANAHDIRSKQGTWGILTNDLLTRRASFEIALIAAFAPFYNRDLYSTESKSSKSRPSHRVKRRDA